MKTQSDVSTPVGLLDDRMGLLHGTASAYQVIAERIAAGTLSAGDVINMTDAFPNAAPSVRRGIGELFLNYKGVATIKRRLRKPRHLNWSLTPVLGSEHDSLIVHVRRAPTGWDWPVSLLHATGGVWLEQPAPFL